jgi:two-component system, OmpR family, response regulator
MERSLKILVIEDDEATAAYICRGLRESGHNVALASNGLDGLDRAVNDTWQVILLDRMLPGGNDGLAILERLRALGNNTPVLVVSALAAIDDRVRGLRLGGDDYLAKPFAFSELLARIEAVARRAHTTEARTRFEVADLVLDLRTGRVTRSGLPIDLQPGELRLLRFLAEHEGQLVTRNMLLEGVWDCHFEPQTNVVNVQISRLRQKIDKGFSPELIHTVRGVGYRFGADG